MREFRLSQFSRLAGGVLWLSASGASLPAQNAPIDPLCATGECQPVITQTRFQNRAAYKLTDGKSEAIIVPSLGRVMSYKLVGGANRLWVAPPTKYKAGEWQNLGGDKTWPAPQSLWGTWQAQGWPPDRAWDGDAHRAEVLSGGKLRTISGVAQGIGARVVREFSFNAQGEFVVEQIVEKIVGPPVQISIWSVTQIVPPDAIFFPTNAQSPFKNNFHWIAKPQKDVAWSNLSPTLLQVRPNAQTSFKIGVDAPVTAIAAVKDGVAFVQRAARPEGDYPDGALGAGFPLELWNNAGPHYNELEILSPLRTYKAALRPAASVQKKNARVKAKVMPDGFRKLEWNQDDLSQAPGTRWKHTIRWSLHALPSADVNAPNVQYAIEQLLAPSKSAT